MRYYYYLLLILALGACQSTSPEAAPETSGPLFQKVPSVQSGILFRNEVAETYDKFFEFFPYVYNGAGVAMGDLDQDGLPDLYFVGNEVPNRLYRNRGKLVFQDITQSAGVAGQGGWCNGVSMVDINHDGHLDLYVCRGGWQDREADRRNLLYVNQGDLTFREEAAAYGLADAGYSMQASFFDADGDGDLDCYLINRPDSFYLPLSVMAQRRGESLPQQQDRLYVNDNGHFVDATQARGITGNYGYSLSVITADVNQDRRPDIFVGNDFSTSDHLYLNQGQGQFADQIGQAMNHLSLYSMGADLADLNNDGLEDLLVMEMKPADYLRSKVSMPSMDVAGFHAIVDAGMHKQYMHNMLHLNQGQGIFSDVSQFAGIHKTDWSWSCLAEDLDNDGHRDLFITNGIRRDLFDGDVQQRLKAYIQANRDQIRTPNDLFGPEGFKKIVAQYRPVKLPNYLFRNQGDLRFANVSRPWGIADEATFSHGAAIGDLDGDGDLDLVVNNQEDHALVYENQGQPGTHYLRVQLQGSAQNPQGLGAVVTAEAGDQRWTFTQKTVRGYLSCQEPTVHVGLGEVDRLDRVTVRWPDGKISEQRDVAADQVLTLAYTEAKAAPAQAKTPEPLFIEVTDEVLAQPFVHRENAFNEYATQVLLPHNFGRSGPCLARGDVNGDGSEDFFVGGAHGQAGQLYLQRNGRFVAKSVAAFARDRAYEDMGATFFDADQDGDLDLYVVSGGAQHPPGAPELQDRLYRNDGQGRFLRGELPELRNSGSVVTAHDLDRDGDLDLFVGGEVVHERYPYPAGSHLLINEEGQFRDASAELAPELADLGLVRTATWANLDNQGPPELIVAGEWLPITVFAYQGGQLKRQDGAALGLAQTEGWWHHLQAVDIDEDGDLDLIAGNQGENYKFHPSPERPFQVYAADFDGNGSNDVFLAQPLQGELKPIRGRECSSQQMPQIAQRFQSFQAFAQADLPSIIGPDLSQALHRQAYTFSSCIFLNEGGRFQAQPLPAEAQFSTLKGAVLRDFDGDGLEDLLIAGNQFEVEVETTPADASPGYLLRGLPGGGFETVPPSKSGFYLPENVKDLQAIEVQGRTLILATVNDGPLRVFALNSQPSPQTLSQR